jgi:hypothetical protein
MPLCCLRLFYISITGIQLSSWKQLDILIWKWTPVFMMEFSGPVIHEHRHSTTFTPVRTSNLSISQRTAQHTFQWTKQSLRQPLKLYKCTASHLVKYIQQKNTPASLAGMLRLHAASVKNRCPVMTNHVKAFTERSIAGWIKVELFITTEFKQKHWFHNLNLLTSMRAGNWDFLCVLKAENILRLLSHASLFCNDLCIRACQHAKLKLYIWSL